MRFKMRTHYKDNSIAEHDSFVGAITDIIFRDDMVDLMNVCMSELQFTAFVWTPGKRSIKIEEHSFVTEQEGVLYMMPKNINE